MLLESVFCTVSAFIFNFVLILAIIQLVFCSHLKKRDHFYARLLLFVPYILLTHTMLAQYGPFAKWGQFNNVPFFIFGSLNFSYVIEHLISVAILYFCFDESPWLLLSIGSAAYVVQNLGHNITELIRTTVMQGDPYSSSGIGEPWYYYIIKILIFSVCISLTHKMLIQNFADHRHVSLDNRQRIVFIVLSLTIISVLNRWIYTERLRNTAVYILMIFSNVMLLIFQFSAFENKKVLTEKETMDQLLYLQKKQYETSREAAEVINRKYHDLKYQIEALKHTENTAQQSALIQELEKAITAYDAQIKTGNEHLDVILSEKRAICESRGIEFGCLADGSALSFMSGTDLYVLFGNLLDNAIEAVLKLPEGQRFISLRVERHGDLVRIIEENPYTGTLRQEKGHLETTKTDTYYHGFGVLSIKSITEQYNGKMTIQAQDGVFLLNLLFFL